MQKNTIRIRRLLFLVVGMAGLILILAQAGLARAGWPAQVPTGSIPTVTGTPAGAIAVVLDNDQGFVNLRSGPGTLAYDIVGVLVTGQQAPALGRSPGGDWIQIVYPGGPGGTAWIYTDLVEIRGKLPIVEPPPTQTPAVTATIDPTLAAQFLVEVPPTRLPTFTPPPPLTLPTVQPNAPVEIVPTRVPMGLVIIGLLVVGVMGTFISFLSR
jgi:hypothetical protein